METSTSKGISLGMDLLIKIYYIITEFILSDTDDTFRGRIAFFKTFFIH